jgi:hypothetical protein
MLVEIESTETPTAMLHEVQASTRKCNHTVDMQPNGGKRLSDCSTDRGSAGLKETVASNAEIEFFDKGLVRNLRKVCGGSDGRGRR